MAAFPIRRETGSKWHAIDWSTVLTGDGVANKLFLRSGLVRKDLLPRYSGRHTPPTWLCSSFVEVDALIRGGVFVTAAAASKTAGGTRAKDDESRENTNAEVAMNVNAANSQSEIIVAAESKAHADGGASADEDLSSQPLHPRAVLLNDPIPDALEEPDIVEQECNPSSSGVSSCGSETGDELAPQLWPQTDAWVIKYTDSSNAYGILFAPANPGPAQDRALAVIEEYMARDGEPRVVQHYISPLLLHPKSLFDSLSSTKSVDDTPPSSSATTDDSPTQKSTAAVRSAPSSYENSWIDDVDDDDNPPPAPKALSAPVPSAFDKLALDVDDDDDAPPRPPAVPPAPAPTSAPVADEILSEPAASPPISENGHSRLAPALSSAAQFPSTSNDDQKHDGTFGHKFHLRVVALVSGCMDVYLYDECRVLFSPTAMSLPVDVSTPEETAVAEKVDNDVNQCATDEVEEKGKSKLIVEQTSDKPKELHAHVTNQSFNKEHPSYSALIHNQALSTCDVLHSELSRAQERHRLASAVESVEDAPQTAISSADGAAAPVKTTAKSARFTDKRGQGIWAQVRRITATTLARLGADRRRFFTTPNTYEVFGLDFVVDKNGIAWLLEANPEPSLRMFGRNDEAELRSAAPLKAKKSANSRSAANKAEPMGLAGGWARFKQNTAAPSDTAAATEASSDEGSSAAGDASKSSSEEAACSETSSYSQTQSKERPAFGNNFEAVPLSERWTLVYSAKSLRQLRAALTTLAEC